MSVPIWVLGHGFLGKDYGIIWGSTILVVWYIEYRHAPGINNGINTGRRTLPGWYAMR